MSGTPEQGALATVTVRNIGERVGREVIQVYVSRPESSVDRPARWLGAFTGIEAGPGAERTVEIPVPAEAFRHWDTTQGRWTIEPGTFLLHIGRSSRDQRLNARVRSGGEPG